MPDGSGGLIVAWADTRSDPNNDIYAQRVQANGALGGSVLDVPPSISETLALGPLSPTPSRSGRLGLRFALPSEGDVFVELLDVAGRRVASRELGSLPAGPHAITSPSYSAVASFITSPGTLVDRCEPGTKRVAPLSLRNSSTMMMKPTIGQPSASRLKST